MQDELIDVSIIKKSQMIQQMMFSGKRFLFPRAIVGLTPAQIQSQNCAGSCCHEPIVLG